MKLKKTCYDPAISRVTVKRYGLVGVLYTIGIILITVGFINPVYYGEALSDVQNLCTTMPFINLVYAALLTQLLLGDLYNPRLSYGLRSFPITQGGWFGTQVILGIVSVLPGILISGIILAAMLTAYRIYILVFLGYAFLSFLFFYGAALLCAVCAGNRLGMLLLYCVVNFIGLFYGWAVIRVFCPLIYGIYLPYFSVKFVPVVQMYDQRPFGYTYQQNLAVTAGVNDEAFRASYFSSANLQSVQLTGGVWVILGFAALGCVLIAIAMVLLRRRKAENVGDLLAFKQLNAVMLVICTVCTGLLLHLITYVFDWQLHLPMLFLGLVLGYYAALMLIKRQTNVFNRKTLLPLVGIMGITLALLTATGLDLFGIASRVPQAEQVEEVRISQMSSSQYPITSSQPEDIAVALQIQQESLDAHRQAEERRPLLERIFGSEEQIPLDESTEGSYRITLSFTLKNGRQFYRMYYVNRSFPSIQPLKARWSSPEYLFNVELLDENHQFDRALLKKKLEAATAQCSCNAGELYYTPATHQLGEQEIDQVLDAILLDCQEGTMAQGSLFHQDYSYDAINFYFPHYNRDGDKYTLSCIIQVYPDSKHTMQFLTDHGFHTSIEAE